MSRPRRLSCCRPLQEHQKTCLVQFFDDWGQLLTHSAHSLRMSGIVLIMSGAATATASEVMQRGFRYRRPGRPVGNASGKPRSASRATTAPTSAEALDVLLNGGVMRTRRKPSLGPIPCRRPVEAEAVHAAGLI